MILDDMIEVIQLLKLYINLALKIVKVKVQTSSLSLSPTVLTRVFGDTARAGTSDPILEVPLSEIENSRLVASAWRSTHARVHTRRVSSYCASLAAYTGGVFGWARLAFHVSVKEEELKRER